MKYKVLTILSMTLALPLIWGFNINQSFAATAEDKMETDKEASELNLVVAESGETLAFSPKIPTFLTELFRNLPLNEFGIESRNQERFLLAEDYQSKECRRYGDCQ